MLNDQTQITSVLEPPTCLFSGVDLNFKMEEVSMKKKMKIIKISQHVITKELERACCLGHPRGACSCLDIKKTDRLKIIQKLYKRDQRKQVNLSEFSSKLTAC